MMELQTKLERLIELSEASGSDQYIPIDDDKEIKSLKYEILSELQKAKDFDMIKELNQNLQKVCEKLHQENNQLKQIKQRIQNRIDSMESNDIRNEQGLTAEGYEILGMLHNFLNTNTQEADGSS